MKKILILILCCLVGGVKAQSFCEVDSVYTMFDRETSQKVIQTKDGNFVVFGQSGLNGTIASNYPKLIVTKMDRCGKVIWRNQYDSIKSCTDCGFETINVWEQEDSSILFFAKKYDTGKYSNLYKINSSGQFLWQKNVGDSNINYNIYKCVRLNQNKYLYVGDYLSGLENVGFAKITDSIGNILLQNNIINKATLFDACIKQDSSLLFLAIDWGASKVSRNDDSLCVIHLDAYMNILSVNKFKFNWDNANIYNYVINYYGTEILMQTNNSKFDTLTLTRIDLFGNPIKENIFAGKNYYINKIKPLKENNFILINFPNRLIDSTLSIVWKEDTSYSDIRTTYDVFLTFDSIMLSVGHGPTRNVGTGNSISDFWFGVKKLSVVWVKKLQIQGNTYINQNSGSVQLSTQVLPASATNKTIFWSINDTNKARVTQTGLVTAKANGTVTVSARTTDGSSLSASQVITISNQGVGMPKEELSSFQINIFPNPASTFVSVQSINVKIHRVELTDIYGKIHSNISNSEQVDLGNIENGYYILKVDTEKGTLFKKLIIKK